MKRMSALLGLLTCTIAFAETPVFSDLKKPIVLEKGTEEFQIQLSENLSTGFIWLLKQYDDRLLQPVHYQFIPNAKKIPGAPGTSLWTFRVKAEAFTMPTTSELSLVYLRPWEAVDVTPMIIQVRFV